jgi:hypothetical protein
MALRTWILVVAGVFTLVGCVNSSPPAETVTVTTERSVTAAPPPTVAAPPTGVGAAPAPTAQSWSMPNLIGSNLQDAQDAIQRLTNNEVFYTGSTDLTGKGRNQILDANWQVCTSTPPPGSTITKDTIIDFGVVRVDSESCP